MRPVRLVLLLFCFVALPVILTCASLFSESQADTLSNAKPNRLRSLLNFNTPSSLFPPSAIISLTYDNSTFFLARPAAFGALLPNSGFIGQLWVGRGFVEDTLHTGPISTSGLELGCSDVPGWQEGDKKTPDQPGAYDLRPRKAALPGSGEVAEAGTTGGSPGSPDELKTAIKDNTQDLLANAPTEGDGTDDYLHHPLADSNPAQVGKPGEPANHDSTLAKKKTKATHADIESLQESAEIAGKIAMLSRGGCGFLEKVKWAQRRGAIALIVGDNERNAQLITMYARGDTSNITIPALFTSYTSAHLLSSLVPSELADESLTNPSKENSGKGSSDSPNRQAANGGGPTFTSLRRSQTGAGSVQRSPASIAEQQHSEERGLARGVLSALGLGRSSQYPLQIVEDSRRPPSSGNIDWVLQEDWNEELKKATGKTPSATTTIKTSVTIPLSTKTTSTTTHRPTGDDFVIGAQDWRDADLLAPKPIESPKGKGGSGKNNANKDPQKPDGSLTADKIPLKGGIITPGSGEYDHQKIDSQVSSKAKSAADAKDHHHNVDSDASGDASVLGGLKKVLGMGQQGGLEEVDRGQHLKGASGTTNGGPRADEAEKPGEEHKGLWVTLTPTNVSTSPFFDTLLVLVVSPLVTLTIVYGLLLLRSRIRRRRWRAPKSVVERLPVRTYHTLATSSSTTSSEVGSPPSSSPTSPLLRSSPQQVSFTTRPRSQTATGVMSSGSASTQASAPSNSPVEKPAKKVAKRKQYTGRQVECVVCLEEYIDGQSRVMSLPCGHEFHADCITPWLITRRRTCPICKGDVVRSIGRSGFGSSSSLDEADEQTADDVQQQVAETVNDSASAAIPIPNSPSILRAEDDVSDIERGDNADDPLAVREEDQLAPRSAWRNVLSSSLNALSGETVWRQTPADRSR